MATDPGDSNDSDSKSTPKGRAPRKIRDIETINADVLVIARSFFAQKTFDQVRLEDIAEKAGTSVTHIMRAFESKEGLFSKAIDQQFKLWDMIQADRNKLGEYLSKYVTADINSPEQIQHIMLFIKGSLNKESRKNIRKKFQEQYTEPYAKWLGGEHAQERALALTSVLFGVSYMRYIFECEDFENPKLRQQFTELLAPILQELIDGKS